MPEHNSWADCGELLGLGSGEQLVVGVVWSELWDWAVQVVPQVVGRPGRVNTQVIRGRIPAWIPGAGGGAGTDNLGQTGLVRVGLLRP